MPTSDHPGPENWREFDTDDWHAPAGWDWIVGDELAHHVWNLTTRSQHVNFGPDPPIMLEALMGFFPSMNIEAGNNNWYLSRIPGKQYQKTDWEQLRTKHDPRSGRDTQTSILLSPTTRPHPLRTRFHSQQYTATGGMFTYSFTQWQGGEVSGFMRIPVPDDLLHGVRSAVEDLPFEEFKMQDRSYSEEWATEPTPITNRKTSALATPYTAPPRAMPGSQPRMRRLESCQLHSRQ